MVHTSNDVIFPSGELYWEVKGAVGAPGGSWHGSPGCLGHQPLLCFCTPESSSAGEQVCSHLGIAAVPQISLRLTRCSWVKGWLLEICTQQGSQWAALAVCRKGWARSVSHAAWRGIVHLIHAPAREGHWARKLSPSWDDVTDLSAATLYYFLVKTVFIDLPRSGLGHICPSPNTMLSRRRSNYSNNDAKLIF